MVENKKRLDMLDMLSERCTASAWSLLQKYQEHPKFSAFLERLMSTHGPLLESDVEQSFRALLIQHPKKR